MMVKFLRKLSQKEKKNCKSTPKSMLIHVSRASFALGLTRKEFATWFISKQSGKKKILANSNKFPPLPKQDYRKILSKPK